jgi:hypothetical protein
MVRVVCAALVLLTAAACADSDERAIRNQLSVIGESLTVPPNDGDLGRIARIATLRNALAPDIQVSIGVPGGPGSRIPSAIAGRDAVLALAGRWAPPAGGVTVEFVDTQVTMHENRAGAQVYCTARVTSGPPEHPVVDARELMISFVKLDGAWVVSAVRPEDTLVR